VSASLKNYLKTEYLLLFLCAIEFLGRFNYIILILFIFLLIKKSIKFQTGHNEMLVYIVLFSFFYFVFAGDTISFTDPFVWICSYLIGVALIKDKQSFLIILFILSLGTGLNGILVSVNSYIATGEIGIRQMPDIWTGNLRGATSQSCAFLIFSGLLISILSSPSIKKLIKFFSIVFLFCAIFNAIMSASRTALLYPIITIILSWLLVINKKNIVRWLIITFSITAIILFIYHSDFMSAKSFYEKQLLYERFTKVDEGNILNNPRLSSWTFFSNNYDKYFWGGLSKNNPILYMHNLILDTYAYAGILTTLLLVLIIVRSFIAALRIVWNTDYIERSYVLCVFVCFLLIFNTEPIIQASNWFFSLFLMYCGMIDSRRNKINLINNKSFYCKVNKIY